MTQQQQNPQLAPQQLLQPPIQNDVAVEEGRNQQQNQESCGEAPNRMGRQQKQFSCVYTTQLTQKRKRWHDGRLIVRNGRAILHDADPAVGTGDPVVDAIELVGYQYDSILNQQEARLQTEKHIIEIQGPWISTNVIPAGVAGSTLKPLPSTGMKKVLGNKFRKVTVGEFVPAPRETNSQLHQPAWRKRNRPLQPGELQQRLCGNRQRLSPTSGGQVDALAGDNHQPRSPTPSWNQSRPNAAVQPLHPAGWNHNQCAQHDSSKPPQPWNPSQPHSFERQPRMTSPPLESTPSQHHMHAASNSVVEQRRPQSRDLVDSTRFALLPPDLANANAVSADKENDTQFIANAFNPGSFYGEEEDDEGISQSGAPDPFKWDTGNKDLEQGVEGIGNQISYADSKCDVGPPEGGNSSLSTMELLQLFGKSSSATPNETNEVSSQAFRPEDDAMPQNEIRCGFQFALPPASDSSSDGND
jgi:Protein of unknown function (DUF2439)